MNVAIAVILLVVLFALNIFCGAVHLPAEDVIAVLTGQTTEGPVAFNVMQIRMPQALTAVLAGAGLSTCGLLLQTAFRNPLAGPSVLGISNGASLGVALVTLAGGGMVMGVGGYVAMIIAAIVGALAVTLLLLFVSSTIRNRYSLLIAGIMISYLITSAIALLTYQSTQQDLQRYVMWGMGNFSMVTMAQLPLFAAIVIISLAMCMPLIKSMNIMLLGDSYAHSLGVSARLLHRRLLLTTGILCAVITAYCGPIAFLGLAVPHIVRFVTRTDNFRTLLPMTIIYGAIIALACNVVCTLPSSSVIPLASVTPLVGAPVVLWVVCRRHA